VPKIKVIPYVSNYRYTKLGEFWTSGKSPFWISKFERLKLLEIRIELGLPVSWSHCLTGRPVAGLTHARQLPPTCRWPERRQPHAPPLASLSVAFLGSEAKADFFTPHSHLRSPHLCSAACLAPLAVAAAATPDHYARLPEHLRCGLHFT
jgi:hypothetical protein